MRIYVAPQDVQGDTITVKGDELHHMRDVMRLKEDDAVSAFNGEGKEYITRIKSIGRNEALLAVEGIKESEPLGAQVTLAQALPRLSKMDSIIQKATELGVHSIIPMITERTISRPKKGVAKVTRWKKIAVESSKQSRRNALPIIEGIFKFADVMKKTGEFDIALLLSPSEEKDRLRTLFQNLTGKNILLLIGPEGGFSKSEEDYAKANGCHMISLGEGIMRCETAAVAALSVINYELSLEQ